MLPNGSPMRYGKPAPEGIVHEAGAATRIAWHTLSLQRTHTPGRAEPRGVRYQGSQNGTTLHQPPQIPARGDFLPKFLLKEAANRS